MTQSHKPISSDNLAPLDRPASSDALDANPETAIAQDSGSAEEAPPEGDPLIAVEDVSVVFEGQAILSNISRTITRGQTVAVIGESGCGKTVFMKTLVALLQPTEGRVLFDGVDLNKLNSMELAKVRRRFGFVFQHAALFDSMNIYDNVAFPIRQNEPSVTESRVRERVRSHLNEVGLPDEVAHKYPAEISGGMQKRVGLARALVLQPELIVYDEPTTGLDPIMSDVINELILHTRRLYPVTSVVVTHDMHTARKVADRVMMFYPRRMLQARRIADSF